VISSSPLKRLILINPGPLREIRLLAEVSRGLDEVRSVVDRETMGAVSPSTQLLAVDSLMQVHHNAIGRTLRAANQRSGRLLFAPDDALQLVVSHITHASTATYWLRLARGFRKIPLKDGQRFFEASTAKSRELRESVLGRVKLSCRWAMEIMGELAALPAAGRPQVQRTFDSLQLQMLCTQIQATIFARNTATGGPGLSPSALGQMRHELDNVRLDPDFPSRSPGEKQLLWLTVSALEAVAGNTDRVRAALRERLALSTGHADAHAQALVSMLGYCEEPAERLAILNDLKALATPGLGPIFSRARVGRAAVFRDLFWHLAVAVEPDDQFAPALFEDAVACYERWVWGRESSLGGGKVRIATTWRGKGRVAWYLSDSLQIRSFSVDPEIVARLFEATDRAPTKPPRALDEAIAFLDAVIGPLFEEALAGGGEHRVQALGQVALLPLLATNVGGRPLGASVHISLSHPNPFVATTASWGSRSFDLVVIDERFAENAVVQEAVAEAQARGLSQPRVITFDSRIDTKALSKQALVDELSTARSVLIFSHIENSITAAALAGLVLGPSSTLSAEEIAALDLSAVTEMVLIGCASGRANPFVGDVTVAHAAALAGAAEVFYTIWPVLSPFGSRVATDLVRARYEGRSLAEFLAAQFTSDRRAASPLALMRP
jgi:hypothetical protein